MLIDPNDSDGSLAMKPDSEDNDELIFDDYSIQFLMRPEDSGMLIIPSVVDDISIDEPKELPIPLRSNTSNNNLSLPSSVPSSLPTFKAEAFTNIMRNLCTSDDVSELPESTLGNQQQSTSMIEEKSNDVTEFCGSFFRRHGNALVLMTVLLTAVLSLSTVVYLLSERNAWLATTMRLEETVRELHDNTNFRLLKEQENSRAREEAALQEQVNLALQLQEVVARLKEESGARILEKQKSEALEQDLLSLRYELKSLDQESQRAKDLEDEIFRLKNTVIQQEQESVKSARLEAELSRLKNEITKKSNDFNKQDSCSTDKQEKSSSGENEDIDSGTSNFFDNCWVQSVVKLELGECARKARESVSQQVLGWGETVAKTQEKVKERVSQDYNEIKEIFRTMSYDSSSDAFDEEVRDSTKTKTKTKTSSKTSKEKESLSKVWNEMGEIFANVQDRVMDQMARDYRDLNAWYNNLAAAVDFHAEGHNNIVTEEMREDAHAPNEASKLSRTEKVEKVLDREVKQVDENKKSEPNRFASVKDTAKTILYSAAVASLATVAVDAAGGWINSFSGDERLEK